MCNEKSSFYSFVIVAKNEEENISLCLKSIHEVGVDKNKYEIILVDNGSTDNTVFLAQSLKAFVFAKPSLSIGGMRNFGASKASGNILIFLDADVLIDEHWFNNLISHLYGRADCVFAPESWYGTPTLIEKTWLQLKGLGDGTIRNVKWCQSGAFMITRKAFESIGGFNVELKTSEDYDFGVRLSENGSILRDGTVCFYHLRTPKTIKSLFFQQVWHGRGSIHAFLDQKFSIRECIGTFLPVVFNLSLLFGLVYFFYNTTISLVFFTCSSLIYLIYAKHKLRSFDKYFFVYAFEILLFIVARGMSPFISGRRLSS